MSSCQNKPIEQNLNLSGSYQQGHLAAYIHKGRKDFDAFIQRIRVSDVTLLIFRGSMLSAWMLLVRTTLTDSDTGTSAYKYMAVGSCLFKPPD